MTRAWRVPRSRSGFTLIELIVVVGLISILVGLLLPAVQSARESARRSLCSKNLGQLMLATQAFESAHGGFPPSSFTGRPYSGQDRTIGVFSTHCMILPHLDQSVLFNNINFSLTITSQRSDDHPNSTAANHSVASFLCPSDPRGRSATLAPNSYRACTGVGGETHSPDGYRMIFDGVFLPAYTVQNGLFFSSVMPLSRITDGLSNTLAFSEKPIGSISVAQGSPFLDWYRRVVDELILTPDQWSRACSSLVSSELQLGAGSTWKMPGAIYTNFFAANPPNSPIPDCG